MKKLSYGRVGNYGVALVLLLLYGGQVCPFLESLTFVQLGTPLAGALAIQWFVGEWATGRLVNSVLPERQAGRRFAVEWGLFILFGLGIAVYNRVVYEFPLDSGLKVIVGMTLLGFFTATYLASEQVAHIARLSEQEGNYYRAEQNFLPLPVKLTFFATVTLLLTTVVLFLIINKDLDWLREVGTTIDPASARNSILLEFGFVVAVILAYVGLNLWAFSRNLSGFLNRERSVLEGAAELRFERKVPIASNDEFGAMAYHTNQVLDHLQEKIAELGQTRDVTIRSLASLAETRDNETGAHILRTQHYVRALAERIRGVEGEGAQLDDETIDLLFKSAPLHDIGKVGIPDNILLKPGKLTDEEYTVMKNHPQLGADALEVAENSLGKNSFLRYAREIALTHHENWDGSGYPQGLKAQEIPLSGRLMAVADVYDALISKRVYKEGFTHEKAAEMILEMRGTKFDPLIVDAFEAELENFQRIADEFSDHK